MKNPFRPLQGGNPFGLTDEQKYYPFASQQEHDDAFNDTIDIVTGVFGAAGRSAVKLIAYVAGMAKARQIIIGMKDRLLNWLGDIFEETINGLDKEEILHAAGRAGAKTFARKLREKYGIDCPIVDFYSDTLAEELGEFIATVINDKLTIALGHETVLFSTVFPPDNIKQDIDNFLTSEINERMNLSVSSVLNQPPTALVNELKTQVIEKIEVEMVNIMTRVKGEQIAEIQVLLSGDTVEEFKVRNATAHAISEVFGMMMQRFSTNKVFGFNINASNYYEMNKKRIHTKMRQARYRETHTEVRHWAQG